MNFFQIHPSKLKGSISIPPSKSHTLRAIFLALLGTGTSRIYHYLSSPDTDAMIKAVIQLGASVEIFQDCLEIKGRGCNLLPAEDVIDAGNSGQVLRFIGAVAALLPTYTIITGDESIRKQRPVLPLLEGLRQLGAFAESSKQDGLAPILVRGRIEPGNR